MATVVNSKTTNIARFISGLAYFIGLLVTWKVIPVELAGRVITFISGDIFNAIVVSILFTVTTVLPAVQKWRSRDKELPEGVKIVDVKAVPSASVVKTVAVEEAKAEAIAKGAIKSALLLLAVGFYTATLTGCSRTCPSPSNVAAYPVAKLQQMQAMETGKPQGVVCEDGVCRYTR